MFDASNRQACRVRASQTSTPLHALTTMNDPTWVEAARNLAQRAMQETLQESEQLQFIAKRVLTRSFQPNELERMLNALQRQRQLYAQDATSAQSLLNVGESKPNAQLDPIASAALTNITLLVMNLDEALTRE